MRYQSIFVVLVCTIVGLTLTLGVVSAQQDIPEQIQAPLNDISARTGTQVTLDDVTSYTFEGRNFENTSLGCPAEGQNYAEVITPGYQFTITYQGQTYDYRVTDDQSTTILCAIEPASENEQPAPLPEPRYIQMDQPAVTIAPLGGTPGTSVDVIANGFPRGTLVLIGIGEAESEYEVLQTQQTSTRGALATTITIPDYFTNAEQVVIVVETDDNSLRVVSPIFTVNNTDNGNMGNPSVSLQPQSGAPGSEVQLTATGYPPNTSVIIGVGLQNTEGFNYSLRETTDAQGNLVTSITIPDDALVNRPYIALVQVEADRDYEAISSAFVPTGPAPTPIPDGNEFTQADMYLIATGDNGQNGVPVGCNDSAIPVQVFFDPTVTPLTSALEQLLSLDTRTYGQSGLYNALYQSDLTVEGINIVEGVATINLTGNLQLGGVCDTPRVEAQIEQTALQFVTVNSVNVLINGQPFADATGR